MPRIALVDPHAPLGPRLLAGLAYPLRDASLYTLIGLSVAHVAALAPLIGWVLVLVVWAMTFVYAATCLRHTANGYAEPPEPMDEDRDSGWAIVKVVLLAMLLLVATRLFLGGGATLALGITLACLLPAIIMPLAFGDDLKQAMNPALWIECMARIGAPYLLLAATLLLAWLLQAYAGSLIGAWLPPLLAVPLAALVSTYSVFLCFHLMGVLVHRHHEALGLQPEAPVLAGAGGQGGDEALLARVTALQEASHTDAAVELLRDRLDARSAEPSLHMAYRRLLRAQQDQAALLAHADTCLSALLQREETRRALGVAQECVALDRHFMPGDPELAGTLAEAAERAGMRQLALHLARGYPNSWPRAPAAPRYGLMAARLLAGDPARRAEAAVLASKLATAFPDCAEQGDIAALLQTLKEPVT
ncbi:MAG TPA: hypothetical protein VFG73_08475 [Rhodanobacteraceae bacterium]|nr:hypothetical protein [Rhodanobacteraceae bacterium]